MKINKITHKYHTIPIPVYCLNEPINNEILIVGSSGKEYASYQTSNLALAFGFTPFSFQTVIRDEWTEIEIDDFIKENKLKILVDQKTQKENKPFTVATHLYNEFFKLYNRLHEYQKERQSLACKQGYVDCTRFPGARRHLPELLYIANKLSREKSSHYSNIKNIAVNAEAQAGEALNVYRALVKIHKAIKDNNLKTRLVGCIHDSVVLYVHKSEIKIMWKILKDNMEHYEYSIPILADIQMGLIWGFSPEIKGNMIESMTNDEIVDYILKESVK